MAFPTDRVASDRAKESVIDSWDHLAAKWDRWTPIINRWFSPGSRLMLQLLALGPGDRVLEMAAGAGAFTGSLAAEVGPTGYVLATDGASEMVRLAEQNARRLGFANVETVLMDAERPTVPPASFDAVTCRQALMFFPDVGGALRAWCAALRPGGRLAVSVFSGPEHNEFLVRPAQILARWAHPEGPKPEPPEAPGPFRLSDPDRLRRDLASAGFDSIRLESVACPLRLPDPDSLLGFYRMILGGLVEDLPVPAQERAWDEVASACADFVTEGGRGAPCELLVAFGRRPRAEAG